MKQFEVQIELKASNTFCFQAATRERAEEIALDMARGDAKKLEPLGGDVTVRVARTKPRHGDLLQRREN
ncbi:MAG: hypothetical protein ACE5JS_05235 [Nitrospinota bacterium]